MTSRTLALGTSLGAILAILCVGFASGLFVSASPYRHAALVATHAMTSSLAPLPPLRAEPIVAAPRRLLIPAIGVNASVESVGLDAHGNMDVPKKWKDVGWYDLGPRPGQTGNAVIAGHLDSTTGPAVFWKLKQLKPGDALSVADIDGKEHRFRVSRTEIYGADDAPLQTIFGRDDGAHLNLITCGGAWDKKSGHYTERLAVFADAEDQW